MEILTDELLSKVAVYWPPGAPLENGEREKGTPVEIMCHWIDQFRTGITQQGKEFQSSATVLSATELKSEGWVWLSTKTAGYVPGTALAEAPADPPRRNKIQSVKVTRDIDNEETMYRAMV